MWLDMSSSLELFRKLKMKKITIFSYEVVKRNQSFYMGGANRGEAVLPYSKCRLERDAALYARQI